MRVCVCVCVCVCVHVFEYVCPFVCVHDRVYVYVSVCLYVCALVFVRLRVFSLVEKYIDLSYGLFSVKKNPTTKKMDKSYAVQCPRIYDSMLAFISLVHALTLPAAVVHSVMNEDVHFAYQSFCFYDFTCIWFA